MVHNSQEQKANSGLADPSAKVREDSLDKLASMTPDEISQSISILREDPNDNVRRAACSALGRCKIVDSISDLMNLASNTNVATFIRRSAINALGEISSADALPALERILSSDEHRGLLHDVITAIVAIGGIKASESLIDNIGTKDKSIKSRICKELGDFATVLSPGTSSKYLEKLRELSAVDSDADVRKACLTSSVKFDGNHAKFIFHRLENEPDEKNRLRCIELLGGLNEEAALTGLCNMLLTKAQPRVRAVASRTLAAKSNWNNKAFAILEAVDRENIHRPDISGHEIIYAITGDEHTIRADLAAVFLKEAIQASDRMISVIASLLIANANGSVIEAGNQINKFETENPGLSEKLHKLRVEIGGDTSLEPILEKLGENLQEHFQKPISELNRLTTENWMSTVRSVYWGFIARLVMSICVFVVGMGITIWSVYLFSVDRDSAKGLWGASVSMIGGIGSMLVIIYSGPLKDIRRSVEDLARSNAIFVGFVHMVLQISHTFSATYLKGNITYKDTSELNALIQKTMTKTMETLAQDFKKMSTDADTNGPNESSNNTN